MRRVLLITRNFPPLLGGMERLNLHMAHELACRHTVRLIGPEGASRYTPESMAVLTAPVRPLSRFLLKTTWLSIQQAHIWKPEIILAGSGLTALPALLAARFCGARAIAYVHGLDLAVRHPVYRAIWRPALRRLDGVIANSRATANLAQSIGIFPGHKAIVPPGVCLRKFDPQARSRFRQAHNLGEGLVLLSVGRMTARKGLREFIAEVLPFVAAQHPGIQLVIIGDTPKDALHAPGQSADSLLAAAGEAGVGNCLRFLGKRSDAELADAYASADLHVFPVRDIPNNPEGFGMVAIEAAAHGLATVAYAAGGVVDAVGEGQSGILVPPGDAKAFTQAVLSLLRHPLPQEQVRAFAKAFDWHLFGDKLSDCIEKILRQQVL